MSNLTVNTSLPSVSMKNEVWLSSGLDVLSAANSALPVVTRWLDCDLQPESLSSTARLLSTFIIELYSDMDVGSAVSEPSVTVAQGLLSIVEIESSASYPNTAINRNIYSDIDVISFVGSSSESALVQGLLHIAAILRTPSMSATLH